MRQVDCKILRVEVDIRDVLHLDVERVNGERLIITINRDEFVEKWVNARIETSAEELKEGSVARH